MELGIKTKKLPRNNELNSHQEINIGKIGTSINNDIKEI